MGRVNLSISSVEKKEDEDDQSNGRDGIARVIG
jgi:hypothetical protein